LAKTWTDQEGKVFHSFCERFEGREKEMVNPLILRGEIQLIADEMGIPMGDVAIILKRGLEDCEE